MKLYIKETGAIETLSIIDQKTGSNYIADFVGNTGAFAREFEKTDKADFAISQADYDWWAKVVADNQALEYRIAELVEEYGYDRVMTVVLQVVSCDLGDYALAANNALNEEFGAKADQVAQAYDDAMMDGFSSESCYTLAVLTANELGGVEIDNSNDGNRSISFAPNVEFVFDDTSTVQITFGGVFP